MAQDLEISQNDKRLYRYLTLPNGLHALLISDPETSVEETEHAKEGKDDEEEGSDASGSGSDLEESGSQESEEGGDQHVKKAAAALAVGVGSFSDPADLQGLSHYLEHMLFMGSDKYPDENEYDSFLAKHGGSSNAFTEMEYTSYHFDVVPSQLHGALDRFAQFFIAPICKADALEREVQAVNNEFVGVQQNDHCRLAQLRSHTARDGHLYRKFTWGNRRSLIEQPDEAGIDVRERLLEYYKSEYSAERMALAVLGGDTLDTLEAWVKQLFSRVPSGRGPMKSFKDTPAPYQGGQMYLMPAVKQAHDLVITFPLPSLNTRYLAKGDDYLSCLVGHEGRGSLLSALKARGWASALSAGVSEGGFERNSAYYLFDVSITLTEPGLRAGDGMGLAVVGLLFEYLAMLRKEGPQQYIYQELADIGSMKARYLEEGDATDFVTDLSSNMHFVAPRHVMLSEFLYQDWDPELVNDLLARLVPGNVRLDLQTSDFDRLKGALDFPGAESSVEPWFELPYVAAAIPKATLERWEQIGDAYSPELALPPRNNFIPTDFSLRSQQDGAGTCANTPDAKRQKHEPAENENGGRVNGSLTASTSAPDQVTDQEGLRVWHLLDRDFNTPRSAAYFVIAAPTSYASPRASAATQLALKLVHDSLNETTYMADVAGLEYAVWPEGKNGIEMKVSGFSHKLPLLIQTVFQSLASFKVDEGSFGRVKEALVRKYENANLNVDRHATYLRLRCLKQIWEVSDTLREIRALQPSDIQDFLGELLGLVFVEALIEGNVTSQEALELAKSVLELLPSRRLPITERPKDRIAHVPAGSSYLLRHLAKNSEEDNSAVEVYLQCGPDNLELRAALDLLEQAASEPCFNTLRTKQQLGYSVGCGVRLTHNILGFAFIVLSGSHAPSHLDARIEAFLADFAGELGALSEEEFKRHRQALIAAKLQKDHSLQDQADRHWEQVTNRRYRFKSREEEVEVLRDITKERVMEVYSNYLLPGSKQRARLAVHVLGRKHAQEMGAPMPEGVQAVTDSEVLRSSLEHFPAPQ